MQAPIYLDHNATTPCAPEVVEAMAPYFSSEYGNPASMHVLGRRSHGAVTKAREKIAACVDCDASELFFTSGATEANNQVLAGVTSHAEKRRDIVISAVEHKSILAPAESLANEGWTVRMLPVNAGGRVAIESLETLINEQTLLVCVQAANNEVGTLQPLRDIVDYSHSRGALVHCDATQLVGKMPVSFSDLGIDFASFSAHKLYGPKGVGALFINQVGYHRTLSPLIRGGGQEGALRAGTLNVPAIMGFAEACRLAQSRLAPDMQETARLRNAFEATLRKLVPEAAINGDIANRLPGTSSVTIPGIAADTLIANVATVCISGGSACTEGTIAPSHVLLAMGLTREQAQCTFRIGIGRHNDQTQIDSACAAISAAIARIRNQEGHDDG